MKGIKSSKCDDLGTPLKQTRFLRGPTRFEREEKILASENLNLPTVMEKVNLYFVLYMYVQYHQKMMWDHCPVTFFLATAKRYHGNL